jgi:hypothetical protein
VADETPIPAAGATAEIEAQLDALMADVGRARAQSEPAPAASVTVAEPPAPAMAANTDQAPAADAAGDELALQIQELLDDAKAHAEQKPTAGATESADGVYEPAGATNEIPGAGATVLGKLDQELAQGADEAIAGHFETVQEVITAAQAHAPAAPATPADPPAPAATAATAPPAGEAYVAAAPSSPVPAPAETAKTGASAADVAHELDTEPRAPTSPAVEAPPAPAPRQRPPAPATAGSPGSPLSCAIRRLLGMLNRPVAALPDFPRQVVGLVAVLTIFNASALLVYVAATNHRSKTHATAPSAAVEPAADAASGTASGHDSPSHGSAD